MGLSPGIYGVGMGATNGLKGLNAGWQVGAALASVYHQLIPFDF